MAEQITPLPELDRVGLREQLLTCYERLFEIPKQLPRAFSFSAGLPQDADSPALDYLIQEVIKGTEKNGIFETDGANLEGRLDELAIMPRYVALKSAITAVVLTEFALLRDSVQGSAAREIEKQGKEGIRVRLVDTYVSGDDERSTRTTAKRVELESGVLTYEQVVFNMPSPTDSYLYQKYLAEESGDFLPDSHGNPAFYTKPMKSSRLKDVNIPTFAMNRVRDMFGAKPNTVYEQYLESKRARHPWLQLTHWDEGNIEGFLADHAAVGSRTLIKVDYSVPGIIPEVYVRSTVANRYQNQDNEFYLNDPIAPNGIALTEAAKLVAMLRID